MAAPIPSNHSGTNQMQQEKKKIPAKLSYDPFPDELPIFQALFQEADSTQNGSVVTHDEAFEVLSRSGLPHPKLKMILNMIGKGKVFLLTKQQFYVAVRLVQFSQNNQSVRSLNLTVPNKTHLEPVFFEGMSSELSPKSVKTKLVLNPLSASSQQSKDDEKIQDEKQQYCNQCLCANLSTKTQSMEKDIITLRQTLKTTLEQVQALTQKVSQMQQHDVYLNQVERPKNQRSRSTRFSHPDTLHKNELKKNHMVNNNVHGSTNPYTGADDGSNVTAIPGRQNQIKNNTLLSYPAPDLQTTPDNEDDDYPAPGIQTKLGNEDDDSSFRSIMPARKHDKKKETMHRKNSPAPYRAPDFQTTPDYEEDDNSIRSMMPNRMNGKKKKIMHRANPDTDTDAQSVMSTKMTKKKSKPSETLYNAYSYPTDDEVTVGTMTSKQTTSKDRRRNLARAQSISKLGKDVRQLPQTTKRLMLRKTKSQSNLTSSDFISNHYSNLPQRNSKSYLNVQDVGDHLHYFSSNQKPLNTDSKKLNSASNGMPSMRKTNTKIVNAAGNLLNKINIMKNHSLIRPKLDKKSLSQPIMKMSSEKNLRKFQTNSNPNQVVDCQVIGKDITIQYTKHDKFVLDRTNSDPIRRRNKNLDAPYDNDQSYSLEQMTAHRIESIKRKVFDNDKKNLSMAKNRHPYYANNENGKDPPLRWPNSHDSESSRSFERQKLMGKEHSMSSLNSRKQLSRQQQNSARYLNNGQVGHY